MFPSSQAVQYTIKQRWFGPTLYVRTSQPANGVGDFEWGPWRKARLAEIQRAIIKLDELKRN